MIRIIIFPVTSTRSHDHTNYDIMKQWHFICVLLFHSKMLNIPVEWCDKCRNFVSKSINRHDKNNLICKTTKNGFDLKIFALKQINWLIEGREISKCFSTICRSTNWMYVTHTLRKNNFDDYNFKTNGIDEMLGVMKYQKHIKL